MAATSAPCCKAVLSQATRLWPNRSTLSDGIMSSDAHQLQNPSSDHDYGNAVDLTHDPADGCDAHSWVRWVALQGFPEVKYLISNGQIWSKIRRAEGWRTYDGSNKHTQHAHMSIESNSRDSTRNWFAGYNATSTTPTGDNDMTSEQAQQLAELRVGQDKLRRDIREISNVLNKIAAVTGAAERLEVLSPGTIDGKIES